MAELYKLGATNVAVGDLDRKDRFYASMNGQQLVIDCSKDTIKIVAIGGDMRSGAVPAALTTFVTENLDHFLLSGAMEEAYENVMILSVSRAPKAREMQVEMLGLLEAGLDAWDSYERPQGFEQHLSKIRQFVEMRR